MGYNWDKLSGHTKEMLGKATGNKKMEMKGKAQAGLGDMKHRAKHTMDRIEDRLGH